MAYRLLAGADRAGDVKLFVERNGDDPQPLGVRRDNWQIYLDACRAIGCEPGEMPVVTLSRDPDRTDAAEPRSKSEERRLAIQKGE